MADSFQEKSEQPTPKRLDEARQKGNVAKSMEVNSALVLIFGAGLLSVTGKPLFKSIAAIFYAIYSGGYMVELNIENIIHYMLMGLESIGVMTLLFMTGIMFVGLASNFLQVGFLFTLEPLQPKFEKLNVAKGFQKILFSKRSLEELIKNLLKLAIVVTIGYNAIMGYKDDLLPLFDQNISQIAGLMVDAALAVTFKIALALLLIAAADYAFQRYEHVSGMKMTKQEVKDEHKQSEGDPKIKSRIRSMQMHMTRNRMMQDVAAADVVITNPTHYAIALKYETDKMVAPLVVAKGRNHIALKIRKIAEENNIPIVEDPPLARALYKMVELGKEVPEQFFQAVAEVLAYVYKAKNRRLDS